MTTAKGGRPASGAVKWRKDAKILAGELAWKTAANVWTVVTTMADDMVNAKSSTLRIREANPCKDVRPPDRGVKKAKQYQELRRLAETKSRHTRRVPIEPNLLPLLRAMHTESGGKGPVLTLTAQSNIARKLRFLLRKAGMTRPELHKGSPTRKPMTWHDLRATGATWMAVREDDPMKIKQRCGQTTFATTEICIREAESLREGFGEPFTTLPQCLFDQWVGLGSGSVLSRSDATIEPKNKYNCGAKEGT
ncbi:MAG: hypothetical protein ABTD50_05265 [Polyangiaceae bacterium]